MLIFDKENTSDWITNTTPKGSEIILGGTYLELKALFEEYKSKLARTYTVGYHFKDLSISSYSKTTGMFDTIDYGVAEYGDRIQVRLNGDSLKITIIRKEVTV